MSRRKWNDGQELVYEDFSAIAPSLERTMYDRLTYEMMQRVENAFFGDSFEVNYASATTLTVLKGLGFQTDNTQTSPEPQKRALYRSANVTPSITSPDGSNDRIDIVVVSDALVDELTLSRKFKDAIDETISTQSMVVQQDWEAEIEIVAGTPAASPSVPATPSGKIKVAEVLVTAVTGISGPGAITDTRTLMPVGGSLALNTLGYLRLTAAASVPISTLMADIDALMVNGKMTTNIFADSVSDPAAPPNSGEVKMYNKGGLMFIRDNGGTITPVGSGGGGGGGLAWNEPAGLAPVSDEENSQEIYLFEQGQSQKLVTYVKVPESYIAGRQIFAYLGAYSPGTSNDWKMQIVTSLIRRDVDAVSSVTNQNTSDSGDKTNTVANQFRNLEIALTNSTGQINSVSVSPGDLLRLELTREAPAGTEDTEDLRFVPTSTEVKFS